MPAFLVGNLPTLLELIAFVRCVVPESESSSKSQDTSTSSSSASSAAKITENPDSDGDKLEMSISVERLSLVLIRVKATEEVEEAAAQRALESGQECAFFGATAERLATITLLGAQFHSKESKSNQSAKGPITHFFLFFLPSPADHKDLSVSLAGLQALDLIEPEALESTKQRQQQQQHHRHIFAAGRCLDPELPDTSFTWSAAKSVFSLTAQRSNRSGYHVEVKGAFLGFFSNLSYFNFHSWRCPARCTCTNPELCTRSPRGSLASTAGTQW